MIAVCNNGTVKLSERKYNWASICYNKVLADTVCNMLGFPMQGNNAQDYLRNLRMFIQGQWQIVLPPLLTQKSTVQ